MVWLFINFFIFLFLVWKAAKQPAADHAREQNEEYKRLLQESQEAYERAEKRLQSLKKRFTSLEGEFQRIKTQAKESAELEARKLKEEAKRVSAYLADEAQRVSRVEQEKARELLQKELWEETKRGVVQQLETELTPGKQKQVLAGSIQTLETLKN